jgi:hypothetical protein
MATGDLKERPTGKTPQRQNTRSSALGPFFTAFAFFPFCVLYVHGVSEKRKGVHGVGKIEREERMLMASRISGISCTFNSFLFIDFFALLETPYEIEKVQEKKMRWAFVVQKLGVR